MRPKGTAVELEQRRLRAVQYFQLGIGNTEVARLMGVHLTSVKRWKRDWTVGGAAALSAKPHSGPASRLTPEQKLELAQIVRAGPLAAGFHTNLWTCRRVAQVIRERFGVEYHRDHVGRILHALGFTQQKPQCRASQRDEVAIERWRQRDWVRIKRGRENRAARSCFLMKRASCCNH